MNAGESISMHEIETSTG